MPYLTELEYEGAMLAVEVDDDTRARLRINGLVRQEEELGNASAIRLSSTVQTGYEWHEFIEAVVEFQADTVVTTVRANSRDIAVNRYPRKVVS